MSTTDITYAGPTLTYAGYLGLDAVLTAGQPALGTLPERHFIAAHQCIELKFRVIVAGMQDAIGCARSGRMADAVRPLQRVVALMHGVLFETEILHQALSPEEFAEFREALGTASGFHSVQFRELELLAGLSADEEYMQRLHAMHGGTLSPALARAATAPTLRDAHHHTLTHGPGPADQVAELIGHLDALLIRWRDEHLRMVEHKLGLHATGTAGHSSAYLASTRRRAVPAAWGPKQPTSPPLASAPTPATGAYDPARKGSR